MSYRCSVPVRSTKKQKQNPKRCRLVLTSRSPKPVALIIKIQYRSFLCQVFSLDQRCTTHIIGFYLPSTHLFKWITYWQWKTSCFYATECVASGTYWAAPSLRRLSLLSSNRTSERRYLQHKCTVNSETCVRHITNVHRLYKTKNPNHPIPIQITR